MSILRELVNFEEQLGQERFAALINSGNTGKVRDFCDELLVATEMTTGAWTFELVGFNPTEMTVGGRIYEIIGFLWEREKNVGGDTMIVRAKEAEADLGEEDGEHLLAHQADIPPVVRGKVVFVFPNWRRRGSGNQEEVAFLRWSGDRWFQHWRLLSDAWVWGGRARLLSRK
ncbi:hypothetical protein A2316_03865 [Candidatus Falkowbacteria bacterium RIFOXYB2_FULL_38_15]|uniref:Uncharacterized protein n=1 Tax=Candidatus Falkowbacteria bacterium RIFOXYA2_FULL_38_12 TaxID=1797993 RepID=A0A1F5S258_9BACT|nr:MAG: hypothetical protein A2257_01320 [Candidatus Falkowbacteria bacterium RIFOXYA2_FULL_38_12]OGF33194.1 MAG: hypothetical protein A2316_03865 [Candidatus Falkowbacteria bacterium RIFOXYB2_FULL_38_15]OGF42117.1 MAG: hypothetical protein A2555_03370 [Candidatus Falkowbacteria bacterium RIFOXYD2_FULL_39_16]